MTYLFRLFTVLGAVALFLTLIALPTLAIVAEGDDDGRGDEAAVPGEANLELTMSESADPVMPGDPLTYHAVLTNHGELDAGAIEVTVVITHGAGVTVHSATPDYGTYTAGTGVWAVPDLPHGESAILTILLDLAPSSAPGSVTVAASVTSTVTPDTTTSNNSAQESTTIVLNGCKPLGPPTRTPRVTTVSGHQPVPTPVCDINGQYVPPPTPVNPGGPDDNGRGDETPPPVTPFHFPTRTPRVITGSTFIGLSHIF